MSSDLLSQEKLCGFLRAVLSVSSYRSEEPHSSPRLPAPGATCSLFGGGFKSEDGFLLLPIREGNANSPDPSKAGAPTPDTDNKSAPRSVVVSHPASTSGKKKRKRDGKRDCYDPCPPSVSKNRRRKGMGFVNGSVSVVHQLRALTAHKSLRIEGRIVSVSVRENGNARAVVLVDLYLPIAVWSGWQFPRSRVLAASLFRHASCNWDLRSTLFAFGGNDGKPSLGDEEFIWNPPECHVLECKLHCNSYGSGKNGLFDLHEIFKSLPSIVKEGNIYSTRIKQGNLSFCSGIWNVSDDVLSNVLTLLSPKDLISVAATCRHLKTLAVSVMPCMKLKLYPHQQAAVEWMLERERNCEVLPHPLFMDFSTEDGFHSYINVVTGKILTAVAPTIKDFRGGLFCDEPGLGKTITALSLILKTYGTLADPPSGVDLIWCMHSPAQKCCYYELSAEQFAPGSFMSTSKRFMGQNVRRGQICPGNLSAELSSSAYLKSSCPKTIPLGSELAMTSSSKLEISSFPAGDVLRGTRSLSRVKRNLLCTYGKKSLSVNKSKVKENANDKGQVLNTPTLSPHAKQANFLISNKKRRKVSASYAGSSETWVQCDACRKWRKLSEKSILDATAAWFCSMNSDPSHQSCVVSEESWDHKRSITYLPGFYTKGTTQGKEQNVSFFTSILKEHFALINSEAKKALNWLANLSQNKLSEMETNGLTRPVLDTRASTHGYHKIFEAFGLVRRVERGMNRWYYPRNLENLAFDLTALKIALTKPLDLFRLYLSRATLIIVPLNLVDHWKMQIQKHVSPGQLRIYVWTDHKKPCAHNLAWDYDIVITTFNRLSAEWGPHKRSALVQVHWFRVILDEGHTLGSSLSLTNKLQMAVSLTTSNRWILTGTPTPNTPNSQVAHLQPMLKFLHEEAYGQNQESWDAGILRPFEAEMDEGRSRLLQLLRRIMISARKVDLKTIPPCIKKVTFLHFTEEHARSYNELVVTVRRNILMADWNDPSHVESLLNPKQWKFRRTTIRNVRLSCCVAGHIKVTDAGQDIQETMDILVQQGLDPLSEEYSLIKSSLLDGGSCLRCKDWCRLPVITPCRHLLCLDCVALDSERCTYPGCGNAYEMQSPEILTRQENPNPKWPVPKDLIELQPSYKQDDWDPDWQATSSSKVAYLVQRLKDLQETNRKMAYCIDENGGGVVPLSSQKSHWGVLANHITALKPNRGSCNMIPEKVIVFSQFLEHIHVIEQQLMFAGIRYAGMYSPMHASNKMKSLMIFQHDLDCMVLLMDGSAALGLDLSFVTHVFLMEPIWDRSMEEQVISRAHRMGASRPIHVETLAMHGTIEEQMLEFLQNADKQKGILKQDIFRDELEGTRAHRTLHDFAESNYLAQLGFVQTNVKN